MPTGNMHGEWDLFNTILAVQWIRFSKRVASFPRLRNVSLGNWFQISIQTHCQIYFSQSAKYSPWYVAPKRRWVIVLKNKLCSIKQLHSLHFFSYWEAKEVKVWDGQQPWKETKPHEAVELDPGMFGQPLPLGFCKSTCSVTYPSFYPKLAESSF